MAKDYDELAMERNLLTHQLEQAKHLKGRPSYTAVENLLKKKREEIKEWVKNNPKK